MKNLRELRKNHGLTMKQFGAAMGVAESTVSLYESGKRSPDPQTLIRIADYFDVSIDYLCGRTAAQEKTHTEPGPQVFSAYEKDLLASARELNAEGQEKLLSYAIDLITTGKYIKANQSQLVQKAQ